MRRKAPENSIIVTFHTTADAIETERILKSNGIPGRLIPAPRRMTADCGIAWVSPATEREAVRRLLSDASIEVDAYIEMEY